MVWNFSTMLLAAGFVYAVALLWIWRARMALARAEDS
jgi:hypothetical protein